MTKDNHGPWLESLYVEGVRNLTTQRIEFSAGGNVIAGPNGSGKSSILESVSLLATGRSFRSNTIGPVIQHDREDCLVQARVVVKAGVLSLGMRRTRTGELTLKINGEPAASLAEFATVLPTIIIDPTSTELVGGPPEGRRRLMDGALFHVEQGFINIWRRYQRALKQRNAGLRHGTIGRDDPWLPELVKTGSILTTQRASLVEELGPVFEGVMAELSPELASVCLSYRPGWDQAGTLEAGLVRSLESDRARGFTHVGPHRADLRLQWGGRPAAEVMSRGQLKLTTIALRLAQGRLMADGRGGSPVYAVDDIAAELDRDHAARVGGLLESEASQVLITTVSEQEVAGFWSGANKKLFHVEQGVVTGSPGSGRGNNL